MKHLTAGMLGFGFVAGMVFTALPVFAQTYPDKPINIIVPFPPGGADVYIRIPQPQAEKILGQPVIVHNRPGANGAVGTEAVRTAKPDGYTLLFNVTSSAVMNPLTMAKKPFDAVKDFEHIAMLVVSNLAFAVHPNVPVKSLRELVDYTKQNPGKISYGTPGSGSLNHLLGELFKSLTGAGDMAHVPYRGGGPALGDLIAGQLPMLTPVMTGQIIELHNAGKLRVLAVTGEKRLSNLPDVPTGVEAGIPDLVAQGFFGLFAPLGTPPDILKKVGDASRQVMNDPEIGRQMRDAGFEPVTDPSPEKTRRTLEADIARWTPIVQQVGLKRD